MNTQKGTIKVIMETKQITDTFSKREFVITAPGEYPQHILFQLTKDRVTLIDGFKEGDEIEVTYFLNGREWTNPKDNSIRYFNSLDAWKIEKQGAEQEPTNEQMSDPEAEDDGLPF